MSGSVHPDRLRQHAREDAKQRFLDRKIGLGTYTDSSENKEAAQQPKWKTEADERQQTSSSRRRQRQQMGTTGGSRPRGEEGGGEAEHRDQVSERSAEDGWGQRQWQRSVHPSPTGSGDWERGWSERRTGAAHGRTAKRSRTDRPTLTPRLLDRKQTSANGDVRRQPTIRTTPLPPGTRRNHTLNTKCRFPHNTPPHYTPPPTHLPVPPPSDDADADAIDREWYDGDEETPVATDDASRAFPAVEAAADDRGARRQARKLTARSQQVTRDNNAWEESRMFQSGVVTATTVDTDHAAAETERKVQLAVHEMKPPFLDGRTVYTRQEAMVSVVKDSSSDLAMTARKGSALLASLREKSERNKMKEKFWEVAGNHIGNVIGVKAQESEEEKKEREKEEGEAVREREAEAGGGVDYRASSQFASHLQDKTAAQSEFSATNSVAAQRQYLPIYTCKDELMRVIRDNPVVVIVGQTG